VVDDEPDLELLLQQRFRRRIHSNELQFYFARNGEEALLELAKHPEVDLVLTDINMPVMDGLTLLGKLHEPVPSATRKGVVVVSAYGDMANIRTAMNRGALDFLMKPIDFQDLEATIANALAHISEWKQALRTREQLTALQQELNIAARIQQAILPKKFPPFPGRGDFELHAAMIPAKEVSGDLFDFILLDEDHLGIVIGDVSGKGVPAALYMAVVRTLLRGAAVNRFAPGECLEHVNKALCSQNTPEMFVTLFYGILNTETGELRFASGGHNLPFLFSPAGHVRQLPGECGGPLVGLFEGVSYSTMTHHLSPGQGILLYTDGVTEAVDASREFFNDERIAHYLAQHCCEPIESLVTNLPAAVVEYCAGLPQVDDITVMALRYLGREESSGFLSAA